MRDILTSFLSSLNAREKTMSVVNFTVVISTSSITDIRRLTASATSA